MAKKDKRSLDSLAMEVAQHINQKLCSEKGISENNRDARLIGVATVLLRFQSVDATERWLLRRNPACDNLPPIDLINSEYGTRHLMKIIKQDLDYPFS